MNIRAHLHSPSGRMWYIAGLVAAVCGAPTGAFAQDSRLVGRLDSLTSATVTRLSDSVRRAGLPSEPLVAAALEGAARQASPDRIVAAVRELAAALGTARQVLGRSSRDDELVSAAGALVAGIPTDMLHEFRRARRRGSLAVPLVILADLVARGIPADTVGSMIADALRGGMKDSELDAFRSSVGRDISSGRSPLNAFEAHRPPGSGTSQPRGPRNPAIKSPPRRGGAMRM